MGRRKDRLEHQIKKEVGKIISEEINHPKLEDKLISVTTVKLSNDLKHAKIFISTIANEEERKEILTALHSAKGYIQSTLTRRLTIKFAPTIAFDYDNSIEYGAKIEKILQEIEPKDDREDTGNNQ